MFSHAGGPTGCRHWVTRKCWNPHPLPPYTASSPSACSLQTCLAPARPPPITTLTASPHQKFMSTISTSKTRTESGGMLPPLPLLP